jgi:hypothetical protein
MYFLATFPETTWWSEMMIRRTLWSALLVSLAAAACGPGDVIVTAEIDRMDPETGEVEVQALQNLPVQLIPFDRDHIFDSLSAAAPSPEPQMPAQLRIQRDSILVAQNQWREAEAQWLESRDRLEQISREMQQYSPAEARYRELFNEFNRIEGVVTDAERRRDDAFERFTRLQQETIQEMDQFRIQLESWEDEAFADFPEIVVARLQETRREIMADTTDATGQARLRPDPGTWWVHARHQLAMEELYWNIRVDVERGEPVELRLNRENAEIRDVF